MAFDFPASPTEGQTFTPAGGPTYTYVAPAWRVGVIGIPDAPNDGKLYGRASQAWAKGVKLAGDTMTGSLTAPTFALDANAYFSQGSGNPYIYWDATDYISYDRTNNIFYFVIGTATKMMLDSSANITLQGNYYSAPGYFVGSGAVALLGTSTAGNVYLRPNGAASTVGQTVLQNTGDLAVGRHVSTGNATPGHFYSNDGHGINISSWYGDASAWYVELNSGNPNWGACYTQFIHVPSLWAGFRVGLAGEIYDFRNAGMAYKVGGGAWADISDARIKDVQGPYTSGLNEVRTLAPKRFYFRGNETMLAPEGPSNAKGVFEKSAHASVAEERKEFIGFIAQEVENAFPEMVRSEPGYIDGVRVEDLRSIDTSALLYALVNAVKELDVKNNELEARLQVLEATNGV